MPTPPVTAPVPTSRAIRVHLVGVAPEPVAVCVRALDGTTWAQARTAIRESGITVPELLYAGTSPLADETLLGHHPLLNGVRLGAAPTAAEPRHLLDLVITEGPETGARTALGSQVQRIGRAPTSSLVLHDPDLSRTHLVVAVDQGRAMVSDAGSTNGSHVDGQLLHREQPAELHAGQRLRAGSTTIALERSLPAEEPEITDESCRVPFQRVARTPLRINEVNLERPTPPGKQERAKLPWPVIVLPMIMSLGMVVLLHNMMFLMFAFLGPVMMIGQHISDRQGGTARTEQQRTDHAAALRRLEADRASAVATELAIRRRITPPVSDLLRIASARDGRLWARSPGHSDYLQCRIGIGSVRSEIRVTGGDRLAETVDLQEAPIAVSLSASRIIGVAGAAEHRTRMLHSLLLQLATCQSPHFLRIVIVCDSAAARRKWEWATQLPHVTPQPHSASTVLDFETGEIACQRILSTLLADDEQRSMRREEIAVSTVVVLDGSGGLCNRSEVTSVLQDVERSGVAVIAAGEHSELPSECAVVLDVATSTSVRVTGAVEALGCPDLPRPSLSRAVATRLAGICDVTPDATGGTVPERAALLDVWREEGCDTVDPAAITARWRTTPASTIAPLGISAEGPLRIDLATDGPHGLIAGTTGAGKSELLQSLVTSLALANRPDRLVFVLVDYKGGAAFQDCAELPHTVGLVTDLDTHLTARALTSLGAEVRRREQQLGTVGAKDIEDYLRIPDAPALPRLVLVIDEFRVLAEEMPDFIDGLVRIAAVGRSLGIHLVLATQRPAGVVSADIRANVNLRIALRVRDSADSQDVIESGDAATISAALPGRAIVRTGGGRPTTFQTARIGGCSTGEQAGIEVAVVGSPGAEPVALTTAAESEGPTDLRRTVEAIRMATAELDVQIPQSPWLPALPAQVLTDDLPADTRGITGRACGDEVVPFGLMDVPQEQCTRTVAWDLEQDGHLAIVGGPRSGRTSLLRAIAIQAATRWPDGGLATYVVDTGAGLGALAALPQCGAVIEREDAGRLSQLVQWLSSEIRSRQQQFANDSITGFAEHVRLGGELPRILLLVDGWEALSEVSEDLTLGRMTEELLQVLRDGSAVGVYCAATGGRALATGRVVSSFSSKLVLRLADPGDAMLLGLRESDLPETMPAGRAISCPDALELQVATPIPDLSGAAVAQHLSQLGANMSAPAVHRFAPMPEHCRREELPQRTDQIVLGIGGPDVGPVGLPLGSFGDGAALIAGPARSGRTTTLATVAHQLGDRPVCWIPGHGQPPDLPAGAEVVDPAEPEKLAAWLNSHAGGAVLVDNLDELFGSPTDELLLDYLQHGRRTGGIVCASGQTEALTNAFRGVVAELRRKQTGIILQPGRRDGDLLGATLGPAGRAVPGRGALVIRSRAVAIQVAT